MNRKMWLMLSFALIGLLSIIGIASAHGVVIEHKMYVENGTVRIDIHADFDSGEVMSDAQVAVFAPNDLANPWKTGRTDAAGDFTFEPDLSIPGTWDIQVRKAGHGDMIHVKITGDEAETLNLETEPAGGATQSPEIAATQPDVAAQPPVSGQTQLAETGVPLLAGSGRTSSSDAPLVQIIVNDGSVVVSDGTVSGSTAPVSVATGYSTGQIIVMAVCVIWGFVGTALFFARKGRK